MVYIAIKKIGNGNRYAYRQESFRGPDGKVRTRCEYIGPVGSAIASKVQETRDKIDDLFQEPTIPPEKDLTLQKETLRNAISTSIQGKTSLKKFTSRLEQQGITVKLNMASTGHISGISFVKGGVQMKGSSIDRSFSWMGLCNQGLYLKQATKRTSSKKRDPLPKDPVVTTKIDLSGRISMKSLQYEHQQAMAKVFGMRAEASPPIRIRFGTQTEHRRRWGGSYVVTLKKKGGSRTAFKQAFSQAVMKSGLEQFARQNPETYRTLIRAFKGCYNRTHSALGGYMKANAELRHRKPGLSRGQARSLSLRFFRKLNPKGLPRDPTHLGLHAYGSHRSPKDELTSLLAEVHKKGLSHVQETFQVGMRKAERELTLAREARKSSGFFSRERRLAKVRCKKAIARLRCHQEMQKKLKLIDNTFFSNHSSKT